MLTMYQKETTPEPAKGPSAAAVKHYREAVQSHQEVDDQVLRDAWRTRGDFAVDRKTWEERSEAAYALAVRVPELQAQLPDLQAAVANDRSILSKPLADVATVGDLLAALRQAEIESIPGFHTPAKQALRDLQVEINQTKSVAEHQLRTTADERISRRLADLHSHVQNLEGQRRRMAELIDLEAAIAKQSRLVDEWVKDAERNERAKPKHRAARAKLEELCSLRPQIPAAIEEQKRFTAELVDLRRQIGELEASRFVVENQLWSK